MSRTIKQTQIAPGIYRRGDSLFAEVRIGSSRDGTQQRIREPFPLGTKIDTLIAWQHGAKRDFLLARPAAIVRGSLAADVGRYLATLPEGPYKTESAYVLQHWIDCPLGAMARDAVTRLDVIAQLSRWIDRGAAVATVNKRLSRLRKCYHGLDGLDAGNPTDKIKFMREPEQESRDIPTRTIRLILDSLPELGRAARGEKRPKVSETKIRLRVMAWSGIPPATLRRVRPRDLDLKHARIQLPTRHKGKGAAAVWVALLPPAVDALRDFAAAGLFGRAWSNSSVGKTWRVGIARAIVTATRHAENTGDRSWLDELDNLPARCKPYDLRHSFGSEIYRRTGDIRAVSELLQHATLETTKRYTRGAVSDRVAAAITQAGATYAAVPTIPTPAATPAPRLRIVHKAG